MPWREPCGGDDLTMPRSVVVHLARLRERVEVTRHTPMTSLEACAGCARSGGDGPFQEQLLHCETWRRSSLRREGPL